MWRGWREALLGAAAGLALAVGALTMRVAAPPPRHATASTASAASLRLAPASGPPGTVVAVSGTVSQALGSPSGYGTLCFGGCADGWREEAVRLDWSGASFAATLRIPDAPWLGPSGPRALSAGAYQVTAVCLRRAPDVRRPCTQRPPQATAAFRLTGPVPVPPNPDLRLVPDRVRPGEQIQISGWAPLTPLLGGRPAGLRLVVAGAAASTVAAVHQGATGDLSGRFTVPAALPGLGVVRPSTCRFAMQSDAFGSSASLTLLPPAALSVTDRSPLGAARGEQHRDAMAMGIGTRTVRSRGGGGGVVADRRMWRTEPARETTHR